MFRMLHVVVFRELIELRAHSLEIKLILIIFLKENNLLPSFVPSLFLFNLSLVLNSECWVFRFIFCGKLSFNITTAVKYISAAVTARRPRDVLWRKFSRPE